jgi:hypothetical protein
MDIEIGTGAASLAADLLRGAKAIGDFIGEPNTKRVFYLVERGYLPVGREGSMLTASKRVLSKHYAKVTRGTAEAGDGGASTYGSRRSIEARGTPPQPPAQVFGRHRSAKPPPLRRKRHRRKREDLPAEAAPT